MVARLGTSPKSETLFTQLVYVKKGEIRQTREAVEMKEKMRERGRKTKRILSTPGKYSTGSVSDKILQVTQRKVKRVVLSLP